MYLRTILPLFSAVFLMGSGVVASPTHASTRNHYHRNHANHPRLNGDAAGLRGPHHQRWYGIEASPFPFAGIFSPSQSTEGIGRTGRMGRPFSGSGIASVYSSGRTASGERMNAGAMTAAHRTLPFGTSVTVVNNRTGRAVVVRINDRGPFVRGRVIDLSPAAARAIGVQGLAPVSLIVGSRGASSPF